MEKDKKYICNSCGQLHYEKHISDIKNLCIFCNIENIEYKEKFKELVENEINKNRRYHYKSSYNITIKDYDAMYNSQEGRCKICNKHQTELKQILNVDHCHKTNKVRGLLCQACNTSLGLMKENKENILNMVEYLRITQN
jgi:hypothetical protein